MAYQALYRKYRPQTFSDVVGQEHITETLKSELSSGKIVHAYLFTGTRGTGKTSCAKILAKAINCQSTVNGDPSGECEMCCAIGEGEITDICEIDAASNNGVESIRELREQVTFAPAAAKYRVYIIDEVHMLSIGAFNALLKTLEEPPAHVVFILATTEVHKLPATILSRCQRFDFRRIDPEKICERIRYIADKEGLKITDDAAALIASAADGGMRDALSILDLCASSSTDITEETVAGVCSMAGNDYLLELAEKIRRSDTEGALMLIDKLHNSSVDMLRLLSELTRHYRDLMILKTVNTAQKPIVCSAKRMESLEKQAAEYSLGDILSVLSVLQNASAGMQTGNRRCEMEMAIIRLCHPDLNNDTASLERRIALLEKQLSGRVFEQTAGNTGNVPSEQQDVTVRAGNEPENSDDPDDDIPLPEPPDYVENTVSDEIANKKPPEPTADKNGCSPVTQWSEILSVLRTNCPLIAGVLQGSNAYVKGDYLLIDTENSQFRSLVNGANTLYRDSIRKAAFEVLGATYKLGPYRKQQTKTDPLDNFAERLKNLQNK